MDICDFFIGPYIIIYFHRENFSILSSQILDQKGYAGQESWWPGDQPSCSGMERIIHLRSNHIHHIQTVKDTTLLDIFGKRES